MNPGGPQVRTWTPMLLTQLAVVLAVLVAGIAGATVVRDRPEGQDVLRVVSAAGSSAEAAGTFRSTFEFSVEGAGMDVSSKGEMLIDHVRQLSSGSLEAPGLGKVEFLQVGSTAYMKVPRGRTAAGGQHWYGVTSEAGAGAFGSQDPLEFLHLLADADDVRTLESEEVNGVDTTRYSVDLDPKRLAEMSKQNGGTTLPPGALDQLKDATADVWVDEDDLPRRMRMTMSVQSIDIGFTFDFHDYGGIVEVTAPAASDVFMVASPAELGPLLAGSLTG